MNILRKSLSGIFHGIHRKILLLNMLSCMLLAVSICIIAMNIMGDSLREQIFRNMNGFTGQLGNTIDNNLKDLINTTVQVNHAPVVRSYLSGNFASEYEKTQSTIDLIKYLESVNSLLRGTSIFIYEAQQPMITTSPRRGRVIYGASAGDTNLSTCSWYNELMNSGSRSVYVGEFASIDGVNNYAVCTKDATNSVVVAVCQSVSVIADVLRNIKPDSIYDAIMFFDTNGNVVYTSGKNEQLKQMIEESSELSSVLSPNPIFREINSQMYVVTSSKSSITGWTAMSYTSQKTINEKLYKLYKYIAFITGAILVLVFVVSFLFSRKLTSPVRRLSALMQQAEAKNYNVFFELKSNDEIGELATSFNHMIKILQENQLLRKEAQIEALMSQINPHFLFNTLEMINSYSRLKGVPEVCAITKNLGDILRYTINEKHIVTVGEELEHVMKYVEIQKIKNPERFEVNYCVDDSLLSQGIEKFLMQPLVENVFSHAFKDTISNGRLTIEIHWLGNDIQFIVQDNGCGMDTTQLELLNQKMNNGLERNGGSIGLRNVNLRLRIKYGDQAGLRLNSVQGEGTRIEFQIPAERL